MWGTFEYVRNGAWAMWTWAGSIHAAAKALNPARTHLSCGNFARIVSKYTTVSFTMASNDGTIALKPSERPWPANVVARGVICESRVV